MPLKAMHRVLEEEVLPVPIAKKPSLLLPAGIGVTLNLVPLTLERVNNLALVVNHDLSI